MKTRTLQAANCLSRLSPFGALLLLVLLLPNRALADCTLTNLGITPLSDLGTGTYRGEQGGLYRGGVN